MLTQHDLNACGMCMAVDKQDHTRLGHGHRWFVGDTVCDFAKNKTATVTGFIDHGDHVVAVHKWNRPTIVDEWLGVR